MILIIINWDFKYKISDKYQTKKSVEIKSQNNNKIPVIPKPTQSSSINLKQKEIGSKNSTKGAKSPIITNTEGDVILNFDGSED